jgi:dihydrofolate reductase
VTRVVTALAVSVDGYIAGPNDGPGNPLGDGGERLFEWYFDGDTPSRLYPNSNFKLSKQSAELFDAGAERVGAVISGRRTYEIANGWGGNGPLPGVPLFVLTHQPPGRLPASDPEYTFITRGIEDAVDQARLIAGSRDNRNVALMGATTVRQALAAGLLDEITLHQVPVLLGDGVRLLDGTHTNLRLARQVNAPGVTHLTYEVLRP